MNASKFDTDEGSIEYGKVFCVKSTHLLCMVKPNKVSISELVNISFLKGVTEGKLGKNQTSNFTNVPVINATINPIHNKKVNAIT